MTGSEKVDAPCAACQRDTKHDIVREYVEKGDVPDDIALSWTHEFQIIQCRGCSHVSFRMAKGTNDDVQRQDDGEWDYVPQVSIFPAPFAGRTAVEGDELLPPKIQRIYAETLAALNGGLQVLCGIGIRAVIETVCADQSAPGRNLAEKIDGLVALNVMTPDGAKILHNLRTMGNSAAHEVLPHSLAELNLAFDVVNHTLLGVYILPIHATRKFKAK
ncbi:DUF4145 domain-containing protein [Stenotrophomonas maltophilia]|uniref:DUF4145 domain-containing protein n=1 Tax=Stenotrophomonas maltophilia TaxID=40324 RepID=UPI0021C9F88A|nr:DUF4145 domain-containing protein [Stenotrophomonas maltophilia]